MPSSSQTIADLNASAVCLMQQQQYLEASRILRNAVEVLRHTTAEESSDSSLKATHASPAHHAPCQNNSSTNTNNNKRLYDSVQIPGHYFASSSACNSSGMFPFFNRALLINLDSAEILRTNNPFENDLIRRLAAVLLYNLALVHHSCGIRTGGSEDLSKALSFYQGAFMSLSSIWDSLTVSDSLLVLALLNNMGHIRANNLDRKEACGCLDLLRRFFAECRGNCLIEEESIFFYITTFIFSEEPLTASPAA